MPRTATTFFQTRLFPRIPGVKYFGLPYTQINPAFNRMLFEDDSTYNPNLLRSELDQMQGDRILLSNENFVGQSLFWHYGNRTRIAQRLHAAMPEATIVLFLRNQADLLKSLYLISLQDHETATLSEFTRFTPPTYKLKDYEAHPKVDLFDFAPTDTYHANERAAGYCYTSLIDLYKKLFPRVEILLYEDFKKNPAEVLTRMEKIFGYELPADVRHDLLTASPVNQGVDARQAKRLRRLNLWYHVLWSTRAGRAFFVRARRRILRTGGDGKRVQWSESEKDQLRALFEEDNRLLNERYPQIGLSNHSREYFL